jgi:hypothetical protein
MGAYKNGIKQSLPLLNGVSHNAYRNGRKMWNGSPVPPPPPVPEGAFSITVKGGNGTFKLPVRATQNTSSAYNIAYAWTIDWGDGFTNTYSGSSSASKTIDRTYSDGQEFHTIIIKPTGTPAAGWFDAFGNSSQNRDSGVDRIVRINTPFTAMMRTYAKYSFGHVFAYCSSLTRIPENMFPPTTTVPDYCFSVAFGYCSSLTRIPENLLPATTIGVWAYNNMFTGCTGLTAIPENLLPATTLTTSCYLQMFYNCTGLIRIPENLLPVTTIVDSYYRDMFYGCTELTYIYMDAEWFTGKTEQSGMFTGCTKITANTAYDDIPAGWK